MSSTNEYVIDGNDINKKLEPYQLTAHQPTSELHHMLSGQAYDLIEKKFIKGIVDEIDKLRPQTVKFVNLEAIASGPYKDYLWPICGGLSVLIDALVAKGIAVTGTIQNPMMLPWNIVHKIDKDFKGLPAPGQTATP